MTGRIFYRLITAEGLVAFSADDRPRVVDYVASLAPDIAARCTLETCQVMSVEACGRWDERDTLVPSSRISPDSDLGGPREEAAGLKWLEDQEAKLAVHRAEMPTLKEET